MQNKKEFSVSYLRTHRRLWGLTQKELAELVSLRNATHLSKVENGKHTPRLEVVLACQVIFGIPPSDMFPDVYAQVEDRVMRSIGQFHLALEHTTSPEGLRKRELCEAALRRAVLRPDVNRVA
jgi:transcriptional regulator with XRE-family HTH domain